MEISAYENSGGLMKYFVEGKEVKKGFISAGLVNPFDKVYGEGLSKIVYKIMKALKEKDTKKLRGELFEEFKNLIERVGYQVKGNKGDAVYGLKDAFYENPHGILRKLFRNNSRRFSRFRKEDAFNVRTGQVGKRKNAEAGLVFLRILQEEEVEKWEHKWICRMELAKLWKNETRNEEVKKYLDEVVELMKVIERVRSEGLMPFMLKLIGYVFPLDVEPFDEKHFLVSKARLFWKKKTPEELLRELKEKERDYRELEYALEKSGKDENWLKGILQKAYDKDILAKLREDWKKLVERIATGVSRDGIIGAFVVRGDQKGKISFGVFDVPISEMELVVLYEKGVEVNDFKKGLESAFRDNNLTKFIGYINAQIVEIVPIDEIIPHFYELKEIQETSLDHNKSVKLVYDLICFSCYLKLLTGEMGKKKKALGVLVLLNAGADNEDNTYPFWNIFRQAYEFFDFPTQTLTHRTIKAFIEKGKEFPGILKNFFISLLKGTKKLEISYKGFDGASGTMYVVFEKPSSGILYYENSGRQIPLHHYLYEIYKVEIEPQKHGVSVVLEDKYITFDREEALNLDDQRLTNWLRNKYNEEAHFCFITARSWGKSNIRKILEEIGGAKVENQTYAIEHKKLAVAYISQKAEPDCLVIESHEFNELMEKLGIRTDLNKSLDTLVTKPADVKDNRKDFQTNGESFYHSELQIFSVVKAVKVDKTREKLLLTLLALSNYESESFQTPFAKFELAGKRKDLRLTFIRNGNEYTMKSSAVLYEILYFLSRIPNSVGSKR